MPGTVIIPDGIVAALDLLLGAFLLGFPRAFAFVSVFAPFMWAGCHRGVVRFGIAAMLALPVVGLTVGTTPLFPRDGTAGIWALLTLKEAVIGLIMGFLMSAPFWAAQLAGAALSIMRAETSDASPLIGDTPLTRLMLALMICAFAYGNGFHAMVDLFYVSHEIWPLDIVWPEGFAVDGAALRALVAALLTFSLSVLMPFLVVITLSELGIAFSSRFMKRLSVNAIALDIRALIILGMLTLSVGVLVDRSEEMLATTFEAIAVLLRASAGR